MSVNTYTLTLCRGGLAVLCVRVGYDTIENETISEYYGALAERWLTYAEAEADRLYAAYLDDTDRKKRYRHKPRQAVLNITRDAEDEGKYTVFSDINGTAHTLCHTWRQIRTRMLMTNAEYTE